MKAQGHGRGIGEGYALVALGMTFAGAIIMFMFGGWALDRWLGVTPLFTLVGTVAGAVLGFLNVYWKLQADIEAKKAEKSGSQGSR